jgi:hypothetical protein
MSLKGVDLHLFFLCEQCRKDPVDRVRFDLSILTFSPHSFVTTPDDKLTCKNALLSRYH